MLVGLAAFSLASVAGGGSSFASTHESPNAGIRSAPALPSSSTDWTLTMNFDTGSFTYYLQPLIKHHTALSGTVMPPNSSCPGAIAGSLVSGRLKMTITFPNTPCAGAEAKLKGMMNIGAGTTSGTFKATFDCAATCTFSGTKTS